MRCWGLWKRGSGSASSGKNLDRVGLENLMVKFFERGWYWVGILYNSARIYSNRLVIIYNGGLRWGGSILKPGNLIKASRTSTSGDLINRKRMYSEAVLKKSRIVKFRPRLFGAYQFHDIGPWVLQLCFKRVKIAHAWKLTLRTRRRQHQTIH